MEAVLSLEGVRAGYGQRQVLHGVDLTVPASHWSVLLGPNGSGKTTMLKLIMGQLRATGGRCRIGGRDCYDDRVDLKRIVGYLPEETYIYDELTAFEHLRFAGDMHGLPARSLPARIAELLARFDLGDHADRAVREYSLGMRRKLGLCLALIHGPRLLLLDEPMNGLDPAAADLVRELLRRLCDDEQVGVLMSTHNLGMIHRYCDQLMIFHQGRVLLSSAPEALLQAHPGLNLEEVFLQTIRAAETGAAADPAF